MRMLNVAFFRWAFPLLACLLTACIGDDIIFDAVDEVVNILNPIDTLEAGGAYQFEAVYRNRVGAEEERPVQWSSSDTTVVSITPAGLATGRRAGEAKIYARVKGELGEIRDTLDLVIGASTTVASSVRTGMIQTTSTYELTGMFSLAEQEDGSLLLALGEDYRADENLPGLYVYLTNNPHSVETGYEIGAVAVFSGAHTYVLPATVGLNQFDYVFYYCKPFRVKVGDGRIED